MPAAALERTAAGRAPDGVVQVGRRRTGLPLGARPARRRRAIRSWRSAPRSSATPAAGSGPPAWSSRSITFSPTSSRRDRCRNAKLTLLLDPDGKLLASHTAAGGAGGGAGLLKLLAAADLATVVKNEVGFVETDRLGAPHIMAFDTIQPLKWTLVTIAETSAVVGEP